MSVRAPLAIRPSFAILVLGMTLCGTGCSSCTKRVPPNADAEIDRDTAQDLRGSDPEVGFVFHTEGTVTMTGGSLTATAGGTSQTAGIDMIARFEDEDETVAVVAGRETKRRTRVIRDEQTVTIRADGRADTHTDPSPLAGETIESERVGDVWTHRLVGKPPTDRQSAELAIFPPPQSAADWLPEGQIKPGHSWEVDARKLTRLLGPSVQFESGSWRMSFEGTVRENGAPYARVAENVDVTGRMRTEKGEWFQVTLTISGTTLFSLNRGGEDTTRLSGTIRFTGRVTENQQIVDLTTTGPITLEVRTRCK